MITLYNLLGQALLQLQGDCVQNVRGDRLAQIGGAILRSLDGSRLAHVDADRIYLAPDSSSLQLAGDRLLTPTGLAVARVEGGTPTEKALLGAAFLLFCSDG